MDSQENNNSNMANDSDEAEKETMEEIEEEEDEEMEEDLVSDDAFWHVEASWLNGFEPGMNIEIVHDEKKYWVAKIINVFSNLLSIKWAGCSSDSWIDVKANKCFPYGYLKNDHEFTFEAPDKVPISYEAACDYEVEYTDDGEPVDKSKPLSLYLSGGLNPAHVFKVGIILEISHRLDPDKHWFAEVKRNVGGRLFVKWVHSCDKEPDSEPNTPVEFWIFYSHPRIYHLGYAKEEGDISYEPVFLYNSWVSDIAKILSAQDAETTQTAKYLLNLAKSKRPPLLDPSSIKNSNLSDLALTFPPSMGKLVPVIIQNKGDDHIIVSSQTGKMVSCYPNDDNVILLPSSWAEEHDFSLYNFEDATNDLRNYLNKHKANEAPIKLIDDDDRIQKFKVNHKLQVVHPHDPTMICEGIVTRLTPPLVWVEISADLVTVLPYNSTDLYPSGFCEDNSYTLTKLLTSSTTSSTTKKLVKRRDESNVGENSTEKSSETKAAATIPPEPSTSRSHVCPRIYFNHKCFTGPLLSKTKIRELPRFVGPGPVLLVMQEVIAKIISVAYVPPRVLNEMSSRSFVELLSKNKLKSARTTNFKAKYNKKAFRDEIIVISDTKDVAEYCKLVCGHLKCCYHLFGPDLYDGDDCPSHCRGLRKTNKVLKRAIYYRQKAAKTKTPADTVGKQVDSPAGSSSGAKELESSENIEPEVETKGRGRRTREAKETLKQGKVSPINANPTTATNTTNQPIQLMTRKLSAALRKGGDDENSQENCPSDKSGDFREESPSDTNFRESTNLSRSKRNDKTYERSIPKSSSNNTNNNTNNNNNNTNNNTNSNNNSSNNNNNNNNKRKYEEIMETVSSNGSENSLDHHLVSQPNRHQQNRRRQHISHLEKKMVRRLPPPPPPPRKSHKPEASTAYKFDPNDRLHPVNWSTRDVSNYFRDNRCYTLSDTLFEHEIDGLALLLLDNKSQWMNLMLGFSRSNNLDDVNKLSQIIRKLKSRFFPGASQNYIQLVINKVALQRQTRQPLNC